jgi:hypothetical protein
MKQTSVSEWLHPVLLLTTDTVTLLSINKTSKYLHTTLSGLQFSEIQLILRPSYSIHTHGMHAYVFKSTTYDPNFQRSTKINPYFRVLHPSLKINPFWYRPIVTRNLFL